MIEAGGPIEFKHVEYLQTELLRHLCTDTGGGAAEEGP
jgi:hypothetical protein